jgi:hypothetical protein
MADEISEKQRQFNVAMDKYENVPLYLRVGYAVSFINVASQIILVVLAFHQSMGWLEHAAVFALAYVLADFVNGLVHLYMDNNEDYQSPAGPLIASFHLHHRTPLYKIKPLIAVYYHESGAKIWLALFMIAAVVGVWQGLVTGVAAYGLLYFSVLSSVAEVSHYLCHTPANRFARWLGRAGILLDSHHHARHHLEDNVSYAFLNAMSDPIINSIARKIHAGYKNTTDTHYAFYTGVGTENRGE